MAIDYGDRGATTRRTEQARRNRKSGRSSSRGFGSTYGESGDWDSLQAVEDKSGDEDSAFEGAEAGGGSTGGGSGGVSPGQSRETKTTEEIQEEAKEEAKEESKEESKDEPTEPIAPGQSRETKTTEDIQREAKDEKTPEEPKEEPTEPIAYGQSRRTRTIEEVQSGPEELEQGDPFGFYETQFERGELDREEYKRFRHRVKDAYELPTYEQYRAYKKVKQGPGLAALSGYGEAQKLVRGGFLGEVSRKEYEQAKAARSLEEKGVISRAPEGDVSLEKSLESLSPSALQALETLGMEKAEELSGVMKAGLVDREDDQYVLTESAEDLEEGEKKALEDAGFDFSGSDFTGNYITKAPTGAERVKAEMAARREMEEVLNPMKDTISGKFMSGLEDIEADLRKSDFPGSDVAAFGLESYVESGAAAVTGPGGRVELGAEVSSFIGRKTGVEELQVEYESPDVPQMVVEDVLGKESERREAEREWYSRHPAALPGAILGEAGLLEAGAKAAGKAVSKAGSRFSSDVLRGLTRPIVRTRRTLPGTDVKLPEFLDDDVLLGAREEVAKTAKQADEADELVRGPLMYRDPAYAEVGGRLQKLEAPIKTEFDNPLVEKAAKSLLPEVRRGEAFATRKIIDVGPEGLRFGKQAITRPVGEGRKILPDELEEIRQVSRIGPEEGLERSVRFTDEGLEASIAKPGRRATVRSEPGWLFGGQEKLGEDLLGQYRTFEGFGMAKQKTGLPGDVAERIRFTEDYVRGVPRSETLGKIRQIAGEESGQFLPGKIDDVSKSIEDSDFRGHVTRFIDEGGDTIRGLDTATIVGARVGPTLATGPIQEELERRDFREVSGVGTREFPDLRLKEIEETVPRGTTRRRADTFLEERTEQSSATIEFPDVGQVTGQKPKSSYVTVTPPPVTGIDFPDFDFGRAPRKREKSFEDELWEEEYRIRKHELGTILDINTNLGKDGGTLL